MQTNFLRRRSQRGFAGTALRYLIVTILTLSSAGVRAESTSDSAAEPTPASDSSYFYNPIDSLKEGGKAIFDSKGKWILLGAAGAVATARIFDKQLQATFKDRKRFGSLEKTGNNYFGTGMPGTILGGSLWLYGNLAGNSKARSAGQAEIEALLTAQIIVSGLKYAIHRQRPDGSDNLSFPSGHNTLAWTTAAVMHEFYGWKWGAIGYATGVITMVGRMGSNRHWFSDTVGGAAAGIIIGGAIARAHKKRLDNAGDQKWSFRVSPQIQQGAPGLSISASF